MLEQIDSAISFAAVMLLLSLLITAAVQFVAAALDVRGRNLRAGLVKLLKQTVPELRKLGQPQGGKSSSVRTLADEVVDAVVTHPSLRVGRSRLKAVRLQEFISILEDLASDAPMQPHALSESVRKALTSAWLPRYPAVNNPSQPRGCFRMAISEISNDE